MPHKQIMYIHMEDVLHQTVSLLKYLTSVFIQLFLFTTVFLKQGGLKISEASPHFH